MYKCKRLFNNYLPPKYAVNTEVKVSRNGPERRSGKELSPVRRSGQNF